MAVYNSVYDFWLISEVRQDHLTTQFRQSLSGYLLVLIVFLIDDETARKLIENIISIGHNYGMAVLAEGVETREQFELLRSFGCDLFQGYYFSRPLSAEAFLAYANESG